ncbi:MAG: hypothetical protein SF162_02130 [bacterium]|nr:hypothetical protein [bacterium]
MSDAVRWEIVNAIVVTALVFGGVLWAITWYVRDRRAEKGLPPLGEKPKFLLLVWGGCCISAGIVFIVYTAANHAVSGGQVIMPLDDAYIHFQYARQIAQGQPFVYNPGLPATSGATSFLYPFVLAFGHSIGFQGLALGQWAMGLGALTMAGSAFAAYRVARGFGVPALIGAVVPLIFSLHGLLQWHFMSGMETGFTVLFTLWTLDGVIRKQARIIGTAGTLLALTRPEGALLALLGCAYLLISEWQRVGLKGRLSRSTRWLALPLIAMMTQPIVNAFVTGSFIASGNASKSLFGMIPTDYGVIIGRVIDNMRRMLVDFITPRSVTEETLGVSLFVYAAFGLCLYLIVRRHTRGLAILILLWIGGLIGAVSTLDTAFWHFLRYQVPLIAAFIPLGAAGLIIALDRPVLKESGLLLLGGAAMQALFTVDVYLIGYALNVGYVNAQPLQMANWLRENAPPGALVAVHDVGMMRYHGGRTTLDIVGLTTPGASEYWRNGPGAVGEYLLAQRPVLIASYGEGHGLGLGYLQPTDLYAEPLAVYPVELDSERNVALAAAVQGIYRPSYAAADHQRDMDALTESYLDVFSNMNWIDALNVADTADERAHAYTWTADEPLGGFPTEFYQFNTFGCDYFTCSVLDGGRRINGEERFTLRGRAGDDAVLVTRVHPATPGTFDVYANDQYIGTRVIPALPGSWYEIATFIPAAVVTDDDIALRIVPNIPGGTYQPYFHWLFASFYPALQPPENPTTIFQDGQIVLTVRDSSGVNDPLVDEQAVYGRVTYRLNWFTEGGAAGDYAYFIHVYAADNLDQVLLQIDSRPGNGSLPPGNWLPGSFRDTIELDVTILPPGLYQTYIGLYNPATFERLMPNGGDTQARFLIDDFEIQ